MSQLPVQLWLKKANQALAWIKIRRDSKEKIMVSLYLQSRLKFSSHLYANAVIIYLTVHGMYLGRSPSELQFQRFQYISAF